MFFCFCGWHPDPLSAGSRLGQQAEQLGRLRYQHRDLEWEDRAQFPAETERRPTLHQAQCCPAREYSRNTYRRSRCTPASPLRTSPARERGHVGRQAAVAGAYYRGTSIGTSACPAQKDALHKHGGTDKKEGKGLCRLNEKHCRPSDRPTSRAGGSLETPMTPMLSENRNICFGS